MRYPHGLETPISRYTKSIGYGWSDQVSAASKPLHCSGGSSDCSRAARHGWKCGWVHHGSTKFTAIPLVKDHLPMNLVDHQMGGSGGHAPFSDESSPCGIVRGIRDSTTWDSVIYGSWGSFRKNGWPSNFHGFFPMFPIFFFDFQHFFHGFSTSSVGKLKFQTFPEARDAAAAIRWGQGGSHQGSWLRSAAADVERPKGHWCWPIDPQVILRQKV